MRNRGPLPAVLLSAATALSHVLIASAAPAAPGTPIKVARPRVEYKENPLGLGTPAPRFSWQLSGEGRGIAQDAYQIRVARSASDLMAARSLVWDSGFVTSWNSVLVPYAGPSLPSRQRYFWHVRVRDQAGNESAWSEAAWWEMGLLDPSDWTAKWIEPEPEGEPSSPLPSPYFRREFRLGSAVRSARLYVTSHGVYEVHINGRRVGQDVLTPGWTSYRTRLQYQTYEVTDLLRSGENAIGAIVGSGWYRGQIGFESHRNHYGSRVGLLAQLEVTYSNGRREVVASDAGWKWSAGPILASEIYSGERYDARREQPGWDRAGFADSNWLDVRVAEHSLANLVATEGPAVRRIQEVRPIAILNSPSGTPVVDMGQNMVGWVRLIVEGPAGTTVTLRHGEVLDAEGELYTENLRAADQTVRYTLKGADREEFEPHFTFQGFRYVAVDGYPGTLSLDRIAGVVVHSDMAPAATFTTSEPLINQLQHNIVWGQKGNFVDVPTDCPQRDERLGWTGDAQAFSTTAAFNMDVASFFTKWLKDVAADQYENGSVPHVIPDVLTRPESAAAASAGWADAAVIIPWNLYLAYGDRRLLEQQYDSMRKWVDYMDQRAGDDHVWSEDFTFGDWLAFATTRSDYPGATTGKDLIATAFFAHSTDLLARTARILGRTADVDRYERLFADIKTAFMKEFVTPEGRIGENTQTAYVLALEFELLPESLRARAAGRLAADVHQRKHLTTGFLGTPHLLRALSAYGYLDEAYMLLQREEYPSWLYPVTRGATTIWERWDGIKPDGSFQSAGMNSFNHYAYGAVGDWMYRVMGGIEIDPGAPGYQHVIFQPHPGGTLTDVAVAHDSPYGRVASHWWVTGDELHLTIDVPANTSATVRLRANVDAVRESSLSVVGRTASPGVAGSRQEDDVAVVDVASGRYEFVSPLGR